MEKKAGNKKAATPQKKNDKKGEQAKGGNKSKKC